MNFEKSNILKEKSPLEKNNQEEIFNIDNEENYNFDEIKEEVEKDDSIKLEEVRESLGGNLNNEKKEPQEELKEGIDFVFEQNPELAKIGSKKEYSEYVKSIFPESKLKDILYHGSSKNDISNFIPGKLEIGVHFGTLDAAKYRGEKSESYKIYTALANISKIKELPDLYVFNQHNVFNYLLKEGVVNEKEREHMNDLYNKKPVNNYRDNGGDAMFEYLQNKMDADSLKYVNEFEDKGSVSYVVFNPNNIHILGSDDDMVGFKQFVVNESET